MWLYMEERGRCVYEKRGRGGGEGWCRRVEDVVCVYACICVHLLHEVTKTIDLCILFAYNEETTSSSSRDCHTHTKKVVALVVSVAVAASSPPHNKPDDASSDGIYH